jgi:hypothetical protein
VKKERRRGRKEDVEKNSVEWDGCVWIAEAARVYGRMNDEMEEKSTSGAVAMRRGETGGAGREACDSPDGVGDRGRGKERRQSMVRGSADKRCDDTREQCAVTRMGIESKNGGGEMNERMGHLPPNMEAVLKGRLRSPVAGFPRM